jgi:hypothetical protein
MKRAAIVLGFLVAVTAADRVWAGQPAAAGSDTSARAVTFRMIRGQPFVTATLDGAGSADFALVATGAPCLVRRELAAQLWRASDASASGRATITIDDVVLRNVLCEVGGLNAIALARLGWNLTFNYASRQVFLRRAREAVGIGHQTAAR